MACCSHSYTLDSCSNVVSKCVRDGLTAKMLLGKLSVRENFQTKS